MSYIWIVTRRTGWARSTVTVYKLCRLTSGKTWVSSMCLNICIFWIIRTGEIGNFGASGMDGKVSWARKRKVLRIRGGEGYILRELGSEHVPSSFEFIRVGFFLRCEVLTQSRSRKRKYGTSRFTKPNSQSIKTGMKRYFHRHYIF